MYYIIKLIIIDNHRLLTSTEGVAINTSYTNAVISSIKPPSTSSITSPTTSRSNNPPPIPSSYAYSILLTDGVKVYKGSGDTLSVNEEYKEDVVNALVNRTEGNETKER